MIAVILYKCTWLESWGSGVVRKVYACQMQGLPEPYYEERPGGIAILFRHRLEYANTNGCTASWSWLRPRRAMPPTGS
ncbi:MAG: hypothetical protein IKH33_03895 [Bacteroidales bacterium]|nr:hypothetical protein [Bacteroidales bacterium]